MTYTVSEIAKGMGATILCGDPERTVSAWTRTILSQTRTRTECV